MWRRGGGKHILENNGRRGGGIFRYFFSTEILKVVIFQYYTPKKVFFRTPFHHERGKGAKKKVKVHFYGILNCLHFNRVKILLYQFTWS
jgi:hypothetical protein